MTNTNVPKWTVYAFLGGLLAFFGLFTTQFYIYDLVSMDFEYNGIELLSSADLTFGKYLPLIVAILGLVLSIVSVLAAAKKIEGPQARNIVMGLTGLMLLILIIYLVMVGTGSIINWDEVVPDGADIDLVKEYASYGVPLIFFFTTILGNILASVGCFLSFNDE